MKDQNTSLSYFKSAAQYITVFFSNLAAVSIPSLGMKSTEELASDSHLLLFPALPITVLMVFYLFAPWVLTSRRWLVIATVISSALMLYCYWLGIDRNLLPTHLFYCFFGAWAGLLSFRIFKRISHYQLVLSTSLVVLALIIVTITYPYIEVLAGKWSAFCLYNLLFVVSFFPCTD